MAVDRFGVYLINLDPTVGSEIQKTRPCLVVSPDEINHNVQTVIERASRVVMAAVEREPRAAQTL